MPIFEYRCASCGTLTEFLERGNGAKEKKCKQCGGTDLDKVFSSFGVQSVTCAPCESGACNVASCPSGSCSLSR